MEFITKIGDEISELINAYMSKDCKNKEELLKRIQVRSNILANHYTIESARAQAEASSYLIDATKNMDFNNLNINSILKKFNIGGEK